MKNVLLVGVFLIAVLLLGCTAQQKQEETKTITKIDTASPAMETVVQVPTPSETAATTIAPETAKKGYPIAKDEALRWKTDAKLVEVSGTNKNGNTGYFPTDGKTDIWKYTFASVLYNVKYTITVTNGTITGKEEFETALGKILYEGAPADTEWKIDSDSAVNTVNLLGGGNDYFINNPRPVVNYYLEFSNTGSVVWTISYYPQKLGQSLINQVDATENSIV
jgi:hypothetical protein